MYIIGMKYWGPHDGSACLVKDGKLVFVIEEERLTRVKHAPYTAPVNAVRACLEYAHITIRDVDFVACPRSSPRMQRQMVLPHILANLSTYLRMHSWQTAILALQSITNLGALTIYAALAKHFGHVPKIVSIPHDQAHLASAFYCSPFERAALLNIEGFAEMTTAVLAEGDPYGIRRVQEVRFPNSLGCFYAAFTDWLGFQVNEGEGKVMGLAPYGTPVYPLSHIIRTTQHGIEYDGRYGLDQASRKLKREFGPPRKPTDQITQRHKDIASSVQARLEDIGLHLLRILASKVNTDNLCLSGGVALNVKMNGLFLQSGLVKDMFVIPTANDAGLSIGAALELYRCLGHQVNYVMNNAYLGPSYSESEIQKSITQQGLAYKYQPHIAETVADLIVNGQIVGWFQDRMEIGPRALGNRSILADPRISAMKDRINSRVKHRESFRPFCPSILDEAKDDYMTGAIQSPFMTIAFQAKPGIRDTVPAVVHVDGSMRPQTLTETANPKFYKLIRAFASKTNVPVVLNTSLNVMGEPICCTPKDAINCFLTTDLDAIALGNFLVMKGG